MNTPVAVVVKRENVRIVIDVRPDVIEDVPRFLRPWVPLRNNVVIFISKTAAAILVVDEEPGLPDEVVMIFVERLKSRRSYQTVETVNLYVVSVTYRWSAGFG
jgi:hypothetical protein